MEKSKDDMDICLWLTLKLSKPWSSSDLASFFTPEIVASISEQFHRLDAIIKVRTILVFLSIDLKDLKDQVLGIVKKGLEDSDDWVKVGAGLVHRWLFPIENESCDDFLKKKEEKTMAYLLDKLEKKSIVDSKKNLDDSIALDTPYLCKHLQPDVSRYLCNEHFAVNRQVSPDKIPVIPQDGKKKVSNMNLLPRPKENKRSIMVKLSPSKRNRTSKFKRQRSKIAVIDIEEVQQIKTTKLQQAEDFKRKKHKDPTSGLIPNPFTMDGNQDSRTLGSSAHLNPTSEAANLLLANPIGNEATALPFPPGFRPPPSYWNNNAKPDQ